MRIIENNMYERIMMDFEYINKIKRIISHQKNIVKFNKTLGRIYFEYIRGKLQITALGKHKRYVKKNELFILKQNDNEINNKIKLNIIEFLFPILTTIVLILSFLSNSESDIVNNIYPNSIKILIDVA